MSNELLGMTLGKLSELVQPAPFEEELEAEEEKSLWNPIFNDGVDMLDCWDRNTAVAIWIEWRILMEHLKEEGNVD